MEILKKLTQIQIAILLVIAGITSLIALDGLSQWHRDYYVSAATNRAFFWAVLLLVISTPLLYYFRRKDERKTRVQVKGNEPVNSNLDFLDEKSANPTSSALEEDTSIVGVVLIIVIFAMIILWGLGILGILG